MSRQPRKERKKIYDAPMHVRRKYLAAHLASDLILRYKRRSMPVIRGDTVKIMRGKFAGQTGKVRKVNTAKGNVEIEGITITKADGKKVPRPIHASNLLITKLSLTDPWRRKKLEEKLSEEEKIKVEKEAEEQIKEEVSKVEEVKKVEEKKIEEVSNESS